MAGEQLRVDTEALRVIAGRWDSLADRLQLRPPSVPVAACSSAAAVAAGNACATAAGSVLSVRVRAAATKVNAAAAHHDTTDSGSANKLAALPNSARV